jgi:hypothetical protein
MKNCTNCGKMIESDATFCKYCGSPVSNSGSSTNSDTISGVFADIKEASAQTTRWISVLRGVYKLCFWVIIIIGLILAVYLGEGSFGAGLLVFVISALIALLLVGFQIVFLDLAEDIHCIKHILGKWDETKK